MLLEYFGKYFLIIIKEKLEKPDYFKIKTLKISSEWKYKLQEY